MEHTEATYLTPAGYRCSRCRKEARTTFLVRGEALCPDCLAFVQPALLCERLENALAVSRALLGRRREMRVVDPAGKCLKGGKMPRLQIEVFEDYGIRSIRLPPSVSLEKGLEMAEDIWDDHDQLIRVRVLREMETGVMACICHWAPVKKRPS